MGPMDLREAERSCIYDAARHACKHAALVGCGLLVLRLVPETASARSGRALVATPGVGLEPTTLRLTVECSAIELPRTVSYPGGGRSASIVGLIGRSRPLLQPPRGSSRRAARTWQPLPVPRRARSPRRAGTARTLSGLGPCDGTAGQQGRGRTRRVGKLRLPPRSGQSRSTVPASLLGGLTAPRVFSPYFLSQCRTVV
jgi:hypothetical protein